MIAVMLMLRAARGKGGRRMEFSDLLSRFESGELQYKKGNEIARLLGVSLRGERDALSRALKAAEAEGSLVRDARGRFVTPEKLGLVRGTVQGSERGFGFLLREDGGEDLFIPRHGMHGARHGDTVYAAVVGGERGDEARVHAVLARGMKELTGTYYREKKGGFIEPDERRFADKVRIAGGARAVTGEKVLVRITAYPDGRAPEGEIVRVLGRSGDLRVEEGALIASAGLPEAFPPRALAEAEKAASERVIPGMRRDFREEPIVTIDGDDSRDFDDAVALSRTGEGYFLGVHIADVSHYVRRGGETDKEAYERGTSVYFPDRVLPMLPESLSNGACSLNEGEDRYTLSCLIRLDGQGRVLGSELVRGVIRSCARMTYNRVNAILAGDAALREQYAPLVPMFELMRELAEKLTARRQTRGCVDLDVKEAHITLGEDGEVRLDARERGVSERIIEEFMILANEAVAEFAAGYELPFVYRIHEQPTEEKAAAFKTYLRELGINARFQPENVRPADYAKVLEQLEGKPLRGVVNNVMLRSMAKAKYSPENCGHFGLASKCYCHFTSPIRRYPDLIVHRVVCAVLEGKAAEAEKLFGSFVPNAAAHCSARERRADEAERNVDELYKVWYMRGHLGEEFEGVISGVTSFGIFVQLENTAEGLVRVEQLPGEGYVFSEERYALESAQHAFRLGDAVRVTVAGCDLAARKCEFLLADK